MTEKNVLMWWAVFKVLAAICVGTLSSLGALALLSDVLSRRRRRMRGEGGDGSWRRSAIYAGSVWHARLKPTVHRFSYPIFYCLLDLDELDVAFPW